MLEEPHHVKQRFRGPVKVILDQGIGTLRHLSCLEGNDAKY